MTDVPITSWWPFLLAVLSWIFSLGVWWAQFAALKDRIAFLEGNTVRKDVMVETLNALRTEIQAVRALLEQSNRNWRDSLHGAKE